VSCVICDAAAASFSSSRTSNPENDNKQSMQRLRTHRNKKTTNKKQQLKKQNLRWAIASDAVGRLSGEKASNWCNRSMAASSLQA
jgi:hypothetical protein